MTPRVHKVSFGLGPIEEALQGNKTTLTEAQSKVYYRARARGRLSPFQADRLAVALGMHPADVWGNAWWKAVEPE